MPVCDFRALCNLTLNDAKQCIRHYSSKKSLWIHQFDKFFGNTRITATEEERITELLGIVRGSGWNMNRQGQCAGIRDNVISGQISKQDLHIFWKTIDSLPGISLRNLPFADPNLFEQLETSFINIRITLRRWHQSSDTICFLTKVILMFNWGQSPAFDSRVRSILKLRNGLSNAELLKALVEMGFWIRDFESLNGIALDELATKEMRQVTGRLLRPLPLGRSFDMLLFSLTGM
jgi:hypothetical protein